MPSLTVFLLSCWFLSFLYCRETRMIQQKSWCQSKVLLIYVQRHVESTWHVCSYAWLGVLDFWKHPSPQTACCPKGGVSVADLVPPVIVEQPLLAQSERSMSADPVRDTSWPRLSLFGIKVGPGLPFLVSSFSGTTRQALKRVHMFAPPDACFIGQSHCKVKAHAPLEGAGACLFSEHGPACTSHVWWKGSFASLGNTGSCRPTFCPGSLGWD